MAQVSKETVSLFSFPLVLRWSWVYITVPNIIIIIIIHSFYIALFSVLEQTHCTHIACDSE